MEQLNLESLMDQRQALQKTLAENGAAIAAALGIAAADVPLGIELKRKAGQKPAPVASKYTRKAKASKKPVAKGPTAPKAAKRSSEELGVAQDKIMIELRGGAALTSEQLQAATGLGKAELALPLKQLIKACKVATAGQKRGTKYSLA